MALISAKTAIIYIGSETFPRSDFKESSAFTAAKDRIADFFRNVQKVEDNYVLDLFDAEAGPNEQDSSVVDFIKKIVTDGVQDLFIYYVGHGGFTPTDNNFYLALKSTRDDSPAISSLTIQILGNTISRHASTIRTFLILDCCFSGAAGMAFMSDANQGPAIQFKDAFPSKGVAMLCASSKDHPALIVENRNITMFTEGFELALRNGDSNLSEKFLSLRQLQQLTYSYIKDRNPGEGVRPQVISPIQLQGDIADIDLFENFGYQDARYDIDAKRNLIINQMTANNFSALGNALMDFVREYQSAESGDQLMESILLASECTELSEQKQTMLAADYIERKKTLYREVMSIVTIIYINAAAV